MFTFCYKNNKNWKIICRRSLVVESTNHVRYTRKARQFIDFKRVSVSGGDGGDGRLSFLSLPYKEWAGPDGGNGGNGGHIIFKADTGVKDLRHLRSQYLGEAGTSGQTKHCHGKSGDHQFIKVPVGTMLCDEDHVAISDLDKPDDTCIAARGGAGGRGNHAFLTNENRAPTIYEKGAPGQQRRIYAELRVVADIGLVGFPNAGKSSLLRAISAAQPKVAAYPFTTLNPYVGIVDFKNYKQISVADIPGLVRGAHRNYGLGFSFLRHVKRCSCLLYVLDLGVDKPWEQFKALQQELELYEKGLAGKPCAIIANKIDLLSDDDKLLKLTKIVSLPVISISARYGRNIDLLRNHIETLYDDAANLQSNKYS